MKHIKLFESFDNIEEDIRNIFQELVDDGIIRIVFNTETYKSEGREYLFIFVRSTKSDSPLYWDDVKDYFLRIKVYLGDKFDRFRIRKHPKYREDIDKNEDTEPDYVNINIDENTNIEYGLWSVVIEYTYKNKRSLY